MEHTHDNILNGAGKRMPYRIPDGLFADLEKNVLREVNDGAEKPVALSNPKAMIARRLSWISVAVAASIAIIVGFKAFHHSQSTDEYYYVERAFANLNEEDQNYLLDVYQDDIFMDEDEEL